LLILFIFLFLYIYNYDLFIFIHTYIIRKNLTNVSKLIKGQLNNETKNEFEKQEAISISLENLKNVISDTHVVSRYI